MAKKSIVNNNKLKRDLINRKAETRRLLKNKIQDLSLSLEERIQLVHKLAKMPRNSSSVRYRNRCELTGRPRGYYRFFDMSRISLRKFGSQGLVPGLTKSSW